MTIEEIATQLLAGMMANPAILEEFKGHTDIVQDYYVTTAIEYAKTLKEKINKGDTKDVECVIINE